jgi:hypothetical protein
VPHVSPAAAYVPEHVSAREHSDSNIDTSAGKSNMDVPKATSASVRKPAVQPGFETLQSAPGLYRAGFKPSQTPAAHNAVHHGAVPGQLVLIEQTAFYTNGSEVWAVSIYRMAVLKLQPAPPNEFSRKAI